MHYKNGRKAEVGDIVIGMTYNRPGVQVGAIESITPNAETCNVVLITPVKTAFGTLVPEYTQCDWLLRADDVWAFVIGVAYSPKDQDYFAKIQNFSEKRNPPTRELSPQQRPYLNLSKACPQV